MSSLLPPLLIVHVGLALTLLLPALLLPLVLRTRSGVPQPVTGMARGLLALQARGAAPVSLGVLLSGMGLVAVVGLELLGEPWLVVAVTLYAVSIGVALFVQRPALRRFVGADGAGAAHLGGSDEAWRRRGRRLRWVSYAMAGLIGAIGFLMSTKPDLW